MPSGQSLTGEKGGVNTPSRVVYLIVRSDKRAGVLPGCPSPTDSEVNKKQSSSMRELWKPFIWPFIVVVVVVSVCYYEMLCISSRSLAVPRCFLFFFCPAGSLRCVSLYWSSAVSLMAQSSSFYPIKSTQWRHEEVARTIELAEEVGQTIELTEEVGQRTCALEILVWHYIITAHRHSYRYMYKIYTPESPGCYNFNHIWPYTGKS